jgi:hypothetical protein
MAFNRKELAKISPEERIEMLREIEEKEKEELKEIGELIKDSMHELKIAKIAEEIVPEQKDVNIASLFEAEQGNIEGAASFPSNAEEQDYRANQLYSDYSQLREMYSAVAAGNQLSEEHVSIIGTIGERINIAEKQMTEGEKTATKLVASKAIIYKLAKETGLQ